MELEHIGRILRSIVPATAQTEPLTSTARPDGCWCGGLGGDGGEEVLAIRVDVGGTLVNVALYPDVEEVRVLVDPEGRRVWRNICPVCPEGRMAELYRTVILAELHELADRWLDMVWTRCGIPAELQGFRLDTSPLAVSRPELIAQLHSSALEWWYFCGKYGAGKTGLSVGYMHEWLRQQRRDMRFVTSPALLAELRATYGHGEEAPGSITETSVMERYSTIPLLVLDDLGSERLSGNGWAEGKLSEILTYRHAHGLQTLITSNYKLDAIAERLGDQGDRIASRIYERCGKGARVIELTGPNLRLV